MKFPFFVGLRYLRAKKEKAYLSIITVISILGVVVGVWALIVVLSVMAGFEYDLKEKILGTNSHIVVLKYGGDVENYKPLIEKVEKVKGVIGVEPFIYSEMMLTNEIGSTGVILKGIDPIRAGEATNLVESMRYYIGGVIESPEKGKKVIENIDSPWKLVESGEDGSDADREYDSTDSSLPNEKGKEEDPSEKDEWKRYPGILIGEELSSSLQLFAGDRVTILSPVSSSGPFGVMTPKLKKFIVAGVFHTGMYEYDAKFTYISIAEAQKFLGMGDRVTGLEIKVNDIYKAGKISDEIDRVLGFPYWSRDWSEMNKNLFSALRLEKWTMGVILTIIIIVAALNIISTLIMVVLEKGRDISILKAMGAKRSQIMGIFIIKGVIIGAIGTFIGLIVSFLSCYLLDRYRFIKLDSEVYYLDRLPVKIMPEIFVIVALVSLTISFIATIYPSRQAAAVDPVEGLRYE